MIKESNLSLGLLASSQIQLLVAPLLLQFMLALSNEFFFLVKMDNLGKDYQRRQTSLIYLFLHQRQLLWKFDSMLVVSFFSNFDILVLYKGTTEIYHAVLYLLLLYMQLFFMNLYFVILQKKKTTHLLILEYYSLFFISLARYICPCLFSIHVTIPVINLIDQFDENICKIYFILKYLYSSVSLY